MERHLVPVIVGLSSFLNSFPHDDEKHKEARVCWQKAKEATEALRDEMEAEEKRAFAEAKVSLIDKEKVGIELCPCKSKECEEDYKAELRISSAKKSQRVLEAKLMIAELTTHLAALEAEQEEEPKKEGNVVVEGGLKEE